MTHHQCLYCGKPFKTSSLTCDCPESQLKWTYTPKLKPIYLQDLISVAKSLPKISNMNHEKLIIDSYMNGKWEAVDKYVTFVNELSVELAKTKPNKSLYRKIMDLVTDYITEFKLYLKTTIWNRDTN
jgi:hypothetical protein